LCALRQALGDDETSFDGFAQADFVGQNAAALRQAAEGEHHRVDLMRIGVDTSTARRAGSPMLVGAPLAE
jgi:hypothetical protein